MTTKITISLDQEIVDGLRSRYGKGQISQFINTVLRPYFSQKDLENSYKELAKEYKESSELTELSEDFELASSKDITNEAW